MNWMTAIPIRSFAGFQCGCLLTARHCHKHAKHVAVAHASLQIVSIFFLFLWSITNVHVDDRIPVANVVEEFHWSPYLLPALSKRMAKGIIWIAHKAHMQAMKAIAILKQSHVAICSGCQYLTPNKTVCSQISDKILSMHCIGNKSIHTCKSQ